MTEPASQGRRRRTLGALAGVAVVVALIAAVAMLVTGDEPDSERAAEEDPSEVPQPAPEPEPVPPEPGFPEPLHAERPGDTGDFSRAFVRPDGQPLKLVGFNVFPLWPDPPRMAFDASHYREIRARGFNVVRFVLPWEMYEPEPGRFEHMEELDRAVSHAREAGLYVVLANIQIDDWNNPPAWAGGADKIDAIARNARGWTRELARRYRDDPTVAAYSLGAELPTTDQNRLLRVYREMISWVREEDADKIVITTAGWGNSSMASADPGLLAGADNVVHSWHDYFAGGGGEGAVSDGYDERGMNTGDQVWDGQSGYTEIDSVDDFRSQLAHQLDWAERADLPVWIGEFGINPDAPNATEWVRQKTRLYDEHGIGRAWWLYDCSDGDFAPRTATCEWRSLVDFIP